MTGGAFGAGLLHRKAMLSAVCLAAFSRLVLRNVSGVCQRIRLSSLPPQEVVLRQHGQQRAPIVQILSDGVFYRDGSSVDDFTHFGLPVDERPSRNADPQDGG